LRSVVLCPFTAGTALWQAQSGVWTLSVCVRGTFSLVHGREAVLADPQEPVGVDRYLSDDPQRSLYAPSDVVPYKPRADVVLVGSAFAPDLEPVEALVARLSLGSLDKSIGVIGDRAWIEGPEGPEPSAPRPFRSMPLTYERAARARDNPHGFDLTRAPLVGALALPNLEAADDEIGAGRTVGFGPVSPVAGSRRGLLRADGWAWAVGGGVGPAPHGFDFSFYNAAPRDQQVDEIRGGDTLVLTNLNRANPRLESRLPTVRAKAFLVPGDIDRGLEIDLRCDTLWIDSDRGVVALSWRGVMSVDSPDEEALGTLVVAAESKNRALSYEKIAKILRDGITATTDSETYSEARPLRPRAESLGELDPDLLPTPGPFKPRRPLPSITTVTEPPAPSAKVPGAPLPVRIQGEETLAPGSWEELTGSDLIDLGSLEDPKTLTGVLQARARVEETFDDVATKPSIQPVPEVFDDPSTTTRRPAIRQALRGERVEDALDEPLTMRALQYPPAPASLSAADYARIALATERGEAARALFDYGLSLPDLARVQRDWFERNAGDPVFAQAFAAAIEAARRGSPPT
jgi:hypothetical protein